MPRGSVVVMFVAFLLTGFAGCTQKAEIKVPPVTSGIDPNLVAADGRDLRTSLKADDVIEAPQWKLGDWFGHHVLFEGGPDGGLHINTVVAEEKGDRWLLATDDKQMAKLDAVFDIPIIGSIAKKDLSSTGFGSPWEPYVFPLKNGATWTKQVSLGEDSDEQFSVKYAVTYNPAISTPDGARPGFDIKGSTDKGVLFAYDFVPDIQWYAHFWQYDLDTEDTEDYVFHVMSMGHGSAWTGTYYVDAATKLIESIAGHGVDPDGGSNPLWLQPEPYKAFTVPEGAAYVYGFVGAGAFAGASELVLVDPKGERYEFQAVDTGEGKEKNQEIDLPAAIGEWKAIKEGAGAVIWNYVFLWSVSETAKTL